MAYPVVQTSSYTEETSNTISIAATVPSGTSENDLLVAFHTTDSKDAHTATGWTSIDAVKQNGVAMSAWWLIAPASPPSTYTFESASAESHIVTMFRITGYNSVTPISSIWSTNDDVGISPICTGIAGLSAIDKLFFIPFGSDNAYIGTEDTGYPATWTGAYVRETDTTSNACGHGVAYKNVAATSHADVTWTNILTASDGWVTMMVAVQPVSGTTFNPTETINSISTTNDATINLSTVYNPAVQINSVTTTVTQIINILIEVIEQINTATTTNNIALNLAYRPVEVIPNITTTNTAEISIGTLFNPIEQINSVTVTNNAVININFTPNSQISTVINTNVAPLSIIFTPIEQISVLTTCNTAILSRELLSKAQIDVITTVNAINIEIGTLFTPNSTINGITDTNVAILNINFVPNSVIACATNTVSALISYIFNINSSIETITVTKSSEIFLGDLFYPASQINSVTTTLSVYINRGTDAQAPVDSVNTITSVDSTSVTTISSKDITVISNKNITTIDSITYIDIKE